MELITNFIEECTYIIALGGPIVGLLLVVLESLIPALPLGVLIALNVNAFGLLFGIILSWIGTVMGSFIFYKFFSYLSNKYIAYLLNKKTMQKIEKCIEKFSKISFTNLVLVITLPFMPSSLINMISAVAKISSRKYLAAILIGKIFTTIFWGYIGKSFLESMTDLKTLCFIGVALSLAYIISKLVGKKMNIE